MKDVGIYAITCRPTNKIYVGQSKTVAARKATHFRDLNLGKHVNSHLQRSYDKYGKDNFTFSVLEFCDIPDLNEKEGYWITKLKTNNSRYGFNQRPAPENYSEPSLEFIQKCRENAIIQHDKNWIYINLLTGELKSVATLAEAGLARNKNQNFIKGIVVLDDAFTLEEYKQVYCRYNDWKNNTDNRIYGINIMTGEVKEFSSIAGAAKELNVREKQVSSIINGKGKTANNWNFAKQEDDLMDLFPIYVVDEYGVSYYVSRYAAALTEFPDSKHGLSYIKEYADSSKSYKGKRFVTNEPDEFLINGLKNGFTFKEIDKYRNGNKLRSRTKRKMLQYA